MQEHCMQKTIRERKKSELIARQFLCVSSSDGHCGIEMDELCQCPHTNPISVVAAINGFMAWKFQIAWAASADHGGFNEANTVPR